MFGSKKTEQKQGSNPSQKLVPIKDIRDGVAILDDGTLVSVIICSSINLALKSSDEQISIILQFQNMLNSLDFTVQFLIQSRELDIRPYLASLEEVESAQTIDLLKIQTREYIEFIKTFTENSRIMTKSFFVVVPFTPSLVSKKGGLAGLLPFDTTSDDDKSQITEERFREYKTQLDERLSIVEGSLARTGVRTALLGTEELIELFYRTYNPGELTKSIKQ